MTPLERMTQFWPEWRIDREIGHGSFGRVYHAVREENGLSIESAVKIIEIPAESSGLDSLYSEGFDENSAKTYLKNIVRDLLAEIRMMVSLKGAPNIVIIEDYKVVEKEESVGWIIYIRMELLTPFTSYITAHLLDEAETVRLGTDICRALSICAQENIIHRDVKPQNIFIDRFGNFKLGDFGIARRMESATEAMSHKGTYNYMAPEVSRQTSYDQRADIYSLGILLYQLRNGGMLPFIRTQEQLTNPQERARALQRRFSGEKLPAPMDAGQGLSRIILKAAAFEASDRYATAGEMLADLESLRSAPTLLYGVPKEIAAQDPDETAVLRPDLNETAVLHRASDETAVLRPEPDETAVLRTDPDETTVLLSGDEAEERKKTRRTAGAAKKTEKEKRKHGWIFAAVPLLLAAAVFLIVFVKPRPVTVAMPGVVGKSEEEAIRLLREEDLSAETEYVFSDEYPEGTVIRQDVSPDEKVYKNTSVVLTVSNGADSVAKLAVTGMPARTNYFVGDVVNPAGLTLEAEYRSGKTETVSDGFKCSPMTLSKAGKQTITVTCRGETASFEVTVAEPVLKSLSVKSGPAKTSYFTGDTLDQKGLTLTAEYNNGKTETVTEGVTCSPTALNKAGKQTITASYGGKTAPFSVDVADPAVKSLSVKSGPSKTSYFVGDKLDWKGLTLTAEYNNGKAETVTEGFTCSAAALNKAGKQTITVTYSGKTTSFEVTVAEPAVKSISVKSGPTKTSYFVGDALDRKGLTLTAEYNNGKAETVTEGFTCSPAALNKAGKQKVTVSYGGKTTSFEVTVAEPAVKSISVKNGPTKTSYFVGDALDRKGLTLTVEYNNGKKETVTDGFTCSPTALNKAGKQKITVSYSGKTTSFEVTVAEPAVKSISVKSGPTKTSYFVGDTLDQSGLTLTVEFNTGKKVTVTDGFTCWPTSLGTAGTQAVTVTYDGLTTAFNVTVSNPSLSSIAVKTNPARLSYYVGDTLDQTGLTLTATYSNGRTETVTGGFTCWPTSLGTAGTQAVTVTYNGKTTSFNVTVENKPNLYDNKYLVDRQTLAVALYNMYKSLGYQTFSYQGNSFSDVTSQMSSVHQAILWAVDTGIMSPTSADKFSPKELVTREQLCVILVRFGVVCGISFVENIDAITYLDNESISSWAQKDVVTCQRAGIVVGYPDGTFKPQNSITHDELTQMLYVFLQQSSLKKAGDSWFSIKKRTVPWTEDGIISDGEYYEVILDPSRMTYVGGDEEARKAAERLNPHLYMSWDEQYLYVASVYSPPIHDNHWDSDPSSMWYSGSVQIGVAPYGEKASSHFIEFGVGRSSDTGRMLYYTWSDGIGSGYTANENDQIMYVNNWGNTIEARIPWSAVYLNDGSAYRNGVNIGIVWSIGQGDYYIHTQLGSGITGFGKHAENFAFVSLG